MNPFVFGLFSFARHRDSKEPSFGNEFRKPVWYDEESDDELFDNHRKIGFEVFTNPLELQKYYEAQMKEMFKAFENFDGKMFFGFFPPFHSLNVVLIFVSDCAEHKELFGENFREEYMKPGFEDIAPEGLKKNKSIDIDLDGEIHADQLHSILQRSIPALNSMVALDALSKSRKANAEKAQPIVANKGNLSDEEKVFNKLHGIAENEKAIKRNSSGQQSVVRRIPHNGGAFEGFNHGPKTFSRGFSIQMTRKPGGVCETRQTVIDSEGNAKTVVKRTVDGQTETTTMHNGRDEILANNEAAGGGTDTLESGRDHFVIKDGYYLPKNLW